MSISKERKAMFLVLLCASLWSIGGIFIKLLNMNSLSITGMRGLFAAITVGIYMAVTKQKFVFCRRSVFTGVILSASAFCFVAATKLTTAANAIVLEFTAPIFILAFCVVFRKQRFKAIDVLVVLMTLFGISLCFLDGIGTNHTFGNILGVGAGAGMAAMYITMGDSKRNERISGILVGQLITAAIGIPFVFVNGDTVTAPALLILIILGVFQLGIPYIILAFATDNCPPFACSLISAAEPLLNPVWVFIFDGERPTFIALVGGLIVIVFITLWCVLRDKQK